MKIVQRSPKQVIQHWIRALESGKYKKIKHNLKNSEGFCCLGVLCDLARKDGGPDWVEDNIYLGERCFLPENIRQYLNLDYYELYKIVHLNDQKGYSFKSIARHIKTNILPKFPK